MSLREKPSEKKYHLTRAGVDKFKTELSELQARRPQLVEAIIAAREQGDLRENSEYQSTKEEQATVESRIAEIERILKNHVVLDEAEHSVNSVSLGSLVHLKKKQGSQKRVLEIVGTLEADPFADKISNDSPVGRNIIGKVVGDQVKLASSDGPAIYQIVDIR